MILAIFYIYSMNKSIEVNNFIKAIGSALFMIQL
jgi:hypothetical protein